MRKIDLIVFRHGETDWNATKRMQGHTDIPLNERGKAQAQLLAEVIFKTQPELILTSDLTRARETAEIVNRNLQVPLMPMEQFREFNLGDYEGRFSQEIKVEMGMDNWQNWISSDPIHDLFRFPRGESKLEVFSRVIQGLLDFLKTAPHLQKVALSSHGGVIWQLLHRSEGSPIIEVLPNCAAFLLQVSLGDFPETRYSKSGFHLGFKRQLHSQ